MAWEQSKLKGRGMYITQVRLVILEDGRELSILTVRKIRWLIRCSWLGHARQRLGLLRNFKRRMMLVPAMNG